MNHFLTEITKLLSQLQKIVAGLGGSGLGNDTPKNTPPTVNKERPLTSSEGIEEYVPLPQVNCASTTYTPTPVDKLHDQATLPAVDLVKDETLAHCRSDANVSNARITLATHIISKCGRLNVRST